MKSTIAKLSVRSALVQAFRSISLLGALACAAPLAWSSTQSGLVTGIRVASRALNGNPTHVMLNSAWTTKPACATSAWWAIIDTDTTQGKNFYAALLAAQAAARPVTLLGSNDCSLRGDMETLWQIHIGP